MTVSSLDSAYAVSTHDGRHSHVVAADGELDLDLASAAPLPGLGDGRIAPLQLFAAACAAGFQATLAQLAQASLADSPAAPLESAVHAQAVLYPEAGRHELGLTLRVTLAGWPPAAAQALVARARRLCPYLQALQTRLAISLDIRTS